MVIDKTLMDKWGLDENKVGAMKGGMFKNSTYWGKKTSVLKSGICKYTRREMWGKNGVVCRRDGTNWGNKQGDFY